jgi:hypothetical protein
MSYYKMMKQIESRIEDRTKAAKKTSLTGTGLLTRSKLSPGPVRSQSDITDEIADYIESIRQQKEEIIRGKA